MGAGAAPAAAEEAATGPRQVQVSVPAHHSVNSLVLVVEDDPGNARLLLTHLQAEGHSVVAVSTAAEALEVAARQQPDAILLDLILPHGDDGLNVLERLKSGETTRSIPVLVVSVLPERKRAMALGAADFFLKPIQPRLLLASLRRFLGKGAARPAPLAGNRTIVVADDHETNREMAQHLLERRGYRVVLARDGDEAIRLTRAEQPALVLMDLAMPVKDGFEAARILKIDPETAGIPLVAFTALAMRGDEERARTAGFDGYLSKPIEKIALEETLKRFIEG